MIKTKPVGVRFNQEVLDALSQIGIKLTPQKALSLYEYIAMTSLENNEDFKNLLKPIFIYALKNPITSKYFYVGRTSFNLRARLANHVAQVNSKCKGESLNYRKINEIKSIIDNGKSVTIDLLEQVSPKSEAEYRGCHEREMFWINDLMQKGHNLTNRGMKKENSDQTESLPDKKIEKNKISSEQRLEIEEQIKDWRNKKCPSYMGKQGFEITRAKAIAELEESCK